MKKAMRTIVITCVAAAFCIALMGCNSGNNTTEPNEDTTNTSQTQQQTPANDTPSQAQSSRDALVKFVDESQSAVESMRESFGSIYSDFGIKAEGDSTLVYYYVFKDPMDIEASAQILAASSDTLESAKETVFAGLRAAGVKDPVIKYQYFDSDGTTLIWEYVIES